MPDKVRMQPERQRPDETLMAVATLMKKPPKNATDAHSFKSKVLNAQPEYLKSASELDVFKKVYDWHFMVLSSVKNSSDLKFFLGILKIVYSD